MSYEDKYNLEVMLFDAITYLETQAKIATPNPTAKIRYQSGLAALDLLNAEYRKITGDYYVDQNRVLSYYKKQWDLFS